METERSKQLYNMLRKVFQPDFSDPDARFHAVISIIELASSFSQDYFQQKSSDLSFDQPAIHQMIFRFWRDVYGYSRFTSGLIKVEPDEAKRGEIQKLLHRLPVHIWSDLPRKTRIAAGFTYWMAVLRPFRYKEEAHVSWDDDNVTHFNAHFTGWAALLFLSKYGVYEFGIDEQDRRVRRENFLQALRYRELSLVTLEFLYGSIFRPKRTAAKQNGHP